MKLRCRRVGPISVPLPAYQTPGAAGLDLVAALVEPLTLAPRARAAVPTGLALEVPPGFEGQVRPRSGLALRHGLGMVNAPGTIDSDYRGEIQVLLVNHGAEPVVIEPLMRMAQLVIAPVARVTPEWADELDPSVRGSAGFGSTGTRDGVRTSDRLIPPESSSGS